MSFLSTLFGRFVLAAFFIFAPLAEGAVLISSESNLTETGYTAFSEGSSIAQEFKISAGEWTIDGVQIFLDPFSSEYLGGLVAGIYHDAGNVKPTSLIAALGDFTTDGKWTPLEPLTLGAGSYWLMVTRVGSFPDDVGWKGAIPVEATSDSPESLLAFSFGRAGRNINNIGWSPMDSSHFPIAITGTGSIPEPGSMALLAAGAVGLVWGRFRKQRFL